MPINSGWANDCGNELFTIGWIGCDVVLEPPCLPIIGYAWLADCPEQHYTLGHICCDGPGIIEGPAGGGGESKRPQILPGLTGNYELAMAEDEEIIAVLQALLASRTKN